MDTSLKNDIQYIRHFNRYYTNILGLLDKSFLGSEYALSEIRILYYIWENGSCLLTDLAGAFVMDKGYLSREVKKLESRGLVCRRPSNADSRSYELSLTDKGLEEIRRLDEKSSQSVAEITKHLPVFQVHELCQHMTAIETLLKDGTNVNPDEITVRHEIHNGDLGSIVHMHGLLYGEEHGYTAEFEGYVAGVASKFLLHHDEKRERIWFAEHNGEIVGTIAVLNEYPDENMGELRWFLLKPQYRGKGLGRRLLTEAVDFSKNAGYKGLRLVTTSDLNKAMGMYAKAGFVKTHEVENDGWHKGVKEEWFDLVF